ncbi:ubiquitin-like small modifier protein 1 [Candidatus Palauibacter irciniicola]|uniref:ubiquitin-like small modifier protein 1 n=1 Tax=Candidatus Palauibacter irciniicola TaxID=3056733 RepID=UPI003B01B78D
MPDGTQTGATPGAGLVRVTLPAALTEFTGGRSKVDVPGAPAPVGEILAGLGAAHPGVHDRLITERGRLRPHVNIFVDGENIRFLSGLDTPVPDGAEVVVLPAVSGG